MIEAAFRSGDLEISETGVYQREITDWIAANYDGFSEPPRRANLNQGVYTTLKRSFVKMPSDGGDDKQKKNKWLPKWALSGSNISPDDDDDENEDDGADADDGEDLDDEENIDDGEENEASVLGQKRKL
jgi:hypothetical protein